MAPEYALSGHLTEKADVYSFGVVAMEIVSGKSNMTQNGRDDNTSLINWVEIDSDSLFPLFFFLYRFLSSLVKSKFTSISGAITSTERGRHNGDRRSDAPR